VGQRLEDRLQHDQRPRRHRLHEASLPLGIKKRRCFVLADGYYEWLRERKDKQPFLYEVDGGKPFALAGLWEWWPGPAGKDEPLETCSLITTDANKLQAEIHDRMPVILSPADYDRLLDPANEDTAALQSLLKPFRADAMTARPVNRYVNNARNEGAECIAAP
jgi:putative SOS response-associated peptidase YedK